MQSTQDTVKALQQAIAKDDLHQILHLSQALTRDNPQDIDYKQCYLIAAIKAKAFGDLSAGVFKERPQDKALQKIYSYYLYASGQYQKCADALSNSKDQGLQLLLAQAYFNLLDYDRSANIMSDLLKTLKLNQEDKELYMVNLLATSTAAHLNKIKQFQFLINSNSCKEMLYNYSLFLYGLKDYQRSITFLNNFQTALDKQDEVDRITVKLFRDFIQMTTEELTQAQKDKKAEEYRNLVKSVKDQNLRCVLNNNILYLSCNVDSIGEYYKNLEDLSDPKNKISLFQLIILRINKLSYLNRKNRVHESVKVINELQAQKGISDNNQFIINKYYALKKAKQFKNAETYARKLMQTNLNLGFCLLVDLFQQANDTKSIVNCLQSLSKAENDHAKNYIFSLLIKDTNLFLEYSNYLQDLIKKSTQLNTLQVLLKLYQNKNDKEKQVVILNRILQINPKNSSARVGLAEVYLENKEINKAEQLLRGIERPSEISDINYLQFIEKNIHVSKKEEAQTAEQQKKAPQKKRIKKKKKLRLPKNVEKVTPGFKPDPQRWLPKWQRKGFKKGKRGKKGGNKTQGLSTVGTEQKNVFNAGNSTSAKEATKQTAKRRKN